jgi:hypothetical protein
MFQHKFSEDQNVETNTWNVSVTITIQYVILLVLYLVPYKVNVM